MSAAPSAIPTPTPVPATPSPAPSVPSGPTSDPATWPLAWSDEFDGPVGAAPDPASWGYDLGDGTAAGIPGWGNNERESYTASTANAATDGKGHLLISVLPADGSQECYYGPCEYTSARLLTKDRLEFQYGRVEARIKVPVGAGLWPAFWMLGADIGEVSWPACGEIDIMEFVGRRPTEILGTLHGPGYSGSSGLTRTVDLGVPVADAFHTFAIEWRPGHVAWFLDGTLYHEATPADVAPERLGVRPPLLPRPQRRRRRQPGRSGRPGHHVPTGHDRRLRSALPGGCPVSTPATPHRPMTARHRLEGAAVSGGFESIDGERFAVIRNVDQMAPFLVNVVTDSDLWLFVASNGPFTAGRGSPDRALFPYQTVDKILRHADTSGALTVLRVTRGQHTALWEPWADGRRVHEITRNLHKSVVGETLVFEEVNHDLGLCFRATLTGCGPFGLMRETELVNLAADPVHVRYLDGWHQVIPPGVTEEVYARLSYLAAGYMRHERIPGTSLAVYTLNASISDRPEPSESLRAAGAWSVGHADPVILLSEGQVAAFRRGEEVHEEHEIRGQVGAYLVADAVHLEGGARRSWSTVGDTSLDHAAVVDLRARLASPASFEGDLRAAVADNRAGIRRRIAGADALQQTADEAATAHHVASVLYNSMRGGTFEADYVAPVADVAAYLRDHSRAVHARHADWLAGLPATMDLDQLVEAAADRDDADLGRLLRTYLPLTFSRRHGDPSRPWNRFNIRLRDESGQPVYWYEGNWRDIFQNWEALGASYPGYLERFIAVFLNATTADGYNPYRITRNGGDWEVPDERDPWSHIGYWGDHQVDLPASAAREPRAAGAGSPRGTAGRPGLRVRAGPVSHRRLRQPPRGIRATRSPSTTPSTRHSWRAAQERGMDGKLMQRRARRGPPRLAPARSCWFRCSSS